MSTGGQNTAVGHNAAKKNTTGTDQVAIGDNALEDETDGYGNTAVGSNTMSEANGSQFNTAYGMYALRNVTGNKNIGIGYGAGDNITSGSNNVIIGSIDASAVDVSDSLIIASGDGTPTWITGDSTGAIAMNHKADVIAVSSSTTTLTLGQTGSYIYWTGGDVTLPASGTVGTQYTIINDTGSSDSVTLNGSNCAMATGFTNAAIADHELASFVCVTANTWIQVG
jgi:hypothetical protein